MVIMVKSAMLDVCSPGLLRDVVAAANVAGGDTRIGRRSPQGLVSG